jgi:Fe-S-cluster containining protein
MHEQTDKAMRKAMRRAHAHPPCKQGCFWCCKEPVYTTASEVRRLLEGMSEAELAALKERASRWWFQFQATKLREQIEPSVHEYRRVNLWCPFLLDQQCSAYDRRPTACRMHLVKAEAHRCADDDLRRTQTFLNFVGLGDLQVTAVLRSLADGETEKMDHLGALLYAALFGIDRPTAARVEATNRNGDLVVHKFDEDSQVI